jgi:hypothetical protein
MIEVIQLKADREAAVVFAWRTFDTGMEERLPAYARSRCRLDEKGAWQIKWLHLLVESKKKLVVYLE